MPKQRPVLTRFRVVAALTVIAAVAAFGSTWANQSDSTDDPWEQLLLAVDDDLETAVETFINAESNNWLSITSLEEFRLSETQFMSKNGIAKNRLQQNFNDQIVRLKTLARAVMDRAVAAKAVGDEQEAKRYVESVNKLGQQMQNANLTIVMSRMGDFLAGYTLEMHESI